MESPPVIVEFPEPSIACVRLNRPEVRNALNMALRQELARTFRQLTETKECRAIILTGNSSTFCAGADLREYENVSAVDVMLRNLHLLWGAVADCPLPIIAAVNGIALGGGCELALHADIIVAGASAKFGQPEVKLGLMPGAGGTQRISRVAGKYTAMKWLLTGQTWTADEALAAGLVSVVVPDAEVFPAALEWARRIAGLPPIAVRQIKELVLESMNGGLDQGLRAERKAFQLLFASADAGEGIKAFLEKRPPTFTGR